MKPPKEESFPTDQCANDGQEATRKTTQYAWAGTARGVAASHMRLWQRCQTTDGHVRIHLTSHADHPYRRHREPQSFRSGGVGHLGLVPLPAAPFDVLEAALNLTIARLGGSRRSRRR